ncbi:hypothetical protein [Microlunatus parietis]|uniref:Uncharacterized protein n=1 Tax=Microlunatus parietis TaxID=682979 RepID=A0A7Y9L6G2_9ACTN|nr:hypothetical protein [Microlunatus parietis]NYE68729.1 hypothetical protein [Microlunatus parietis]
MTTAGDGPDGTTTAAVHDCLLPGIDHPDDAADDDRLGRLAFPMVSAPPIRDGRATATWSTVPLTSPDLILHLRAPLLTRPDVA